MFSKTKQTRFNIDTKDGNGISLTYTDGDDYVSVIITDESGVIHLTPNELTELQSAIIGAMIAAPMNDEQLVQVEKQYASERGYQPERDV